MQPRPKALKAIKEERGSAKQEMKAVVNVASYAGLDLCRIFPSSPLLPLNPEREERLTTLLENCPHAYVTDKTSGESRWDCPMQQAGCESHVRLILCPDEGGPLWSAYQYMAHNHAAVGFRRDELLLDCTYRRQHESKRTCILPYAQEHIQGTSCMLTSAG